MSVSITGRDSYIIMQALVYASEWLASLPVLYDERSNREDMNALLNATRSSASIENYRQAAREKLAGAKLAILHGEENEVAP